MSPIALFFLIITPALYAFVGVLVKKGASVMPPFAIIAVSTFVVFAASLTLSLLLEKEFSWSASENRSVLYVLLLAGLINVIAYWCFIRALAFVPVWQVEMFGLLSPIFAGVIAFLILGEVVTPQLFIGLSIVSVGLYVAVK